MLISVRMFGRWPEVNKGERWVIIKVSVNVVIKHNVTSIKIKL